MASRPAPSALYAGEELLIVNKAPTITYFKRGDPARPLVVCIPGAAHLARIFYGGHDGGRSSDFLAHWLQALGYNVLAISYPVESELALMPPSSADFTPREWGAQAAKVTDQVVHDEALSGHVILLVWSMGGRIIQPYALAVKEYMYAIKIDCAVSLVATPPLRDALGFPGRLRASKPGYLRIAPANEEYFLTQLHQQNARQDGRCIIPDDIYLREYVASYPSALGEPTSSRFCKERKPEDGSVGSHEADELSGFSDWPFLCAIYGDSPTDLRHSIEDKSLWGFLLSHRFLLALERQNGESLLLENQNKGKRVIQLIHQAADRVTAALPGGHHIFVGEAGAKATANLVFQFEQQVETLRAEISSEIEGLDIV